MNTSPPLPPQWAPPLLDDCDERSYPTPLPHDSIAGTDQLISRLRYHSESGDTLVDFALVQQRKDKGRWKTVAEVDCRHGEVHVHRYDRDGNESATTTSLHPLTCAADVQMGYNIAIDHVFEKWTTYRGKWS
jgi:hypothetical protein